MNLLFKLLFNQIKIFQLARPLTSTSHSFLINKLIKGIYCITSKMYKGPEKLYNREKMDFCFINNIFV